MAIHRDRHFARKDEGIEKGCRGTRAQRSRAMGEGRALRSQAGASPRFCACGPGRARRRPMQVMTKSQQRSPLRWPLVFRLTRSVRDRPEVARTRATVDSSSLFTECGPVRAAPPILGVQPSALPLSYGCHEPPEGFEPSTARSTGCVAKTACGFQAHRGTSMMNRYPDTTRRHTFAGYGIAPMPDNVIPCSCGDSNPNHMGKQPFGNALPYRTLADPVRCILPVHPQPLLRPTPLRCFRSY